MASMSVIRKAIIDRLGVFDDLTFYWYEPDEIDAPAVFVMPDSPFVSYQEGRGNGEWRFVLTLLLDRVDEEAAQEALDGYVDPGGRFVARLREQGVGDQLAELSNEFVDVASGTNYGEYTRGHTKYLIAQLKLIVTA